MVGNVVMAKFPVPVRGVGDALRGRVGGGLGRLCAASTVGKGVGGSGGGGDADGAGS